MAKPSKTARLFTQLDQLRAYFLTKKLDASELDNVCLDVAEILSRLNHGDYQDSNFLSRNTFDIPRRTREFFNYFKGYHRQAKTWEAILRGLRLDEIDTVIDLCPGWAPKIELALHYLGFKGNVVIFDKNGQAVKQITDFIRLFRCRYKIKTLQANLFSSAKKPRAQLVIANHIIDDLLLDRYAGELKYSIEDAYASEETFKKTVRQVGTRLSQDRASFVRAVAKNIDNLLAEGGFFVMAQYPGLAETSLRLTEWSKQCIEMMFEIKQQMMRNHGYTDKTKAFANRIKRLPRKYFSEANLVVLKNSSGPIGKV